MEYWENRVSKTSVHFYQTKRYRTREDRIFHIHSRYNLIYYIYYPTKKNLIRQIDS